MAMPPRPTPAHFPAATRSANHPRSACTRLTGASACYGTTPANALPERKARATARSACPLRRRRRACLRLQAARMTAMPETPARIASSSPRPSRAVVAASATRTARRHHARRSFALGHLRNGPARRAVPAPAQDVVVAGGPAVAVAVVDTIVAGRMAVVPPAADVPAGARHLHRTRVAGCEARVPAERGAPRARAQSRRDQARRAGTARATVAIDAAVAAADARIGDVARSGRSTRARHSRFAVRIAEALVVRAPRIIERRPGWVFASTVRSGLALGIHIAEATLAIAGVGAGARARLQRRNGRARSRAGGARRAMILRNAPRQEARGGAPDVPCRAARHGSVRRLRRGARVPRDRRVEGARVVTALAAFYLVARDRLLATAPQGGHERDDRGEPREAHGPDGKAQSGPTPLPCHGS
jgi:hypothetical protein